MPEFIDADGYWGRCPICHEPPEILNIGRIHFAHCEDHAVRWCIGENLFSGWRDEDKATWERNEAYLRNCRPVRPFYLDDDTVRQMSGGAHA